MRETLKLIAVLTVIALLVGLMIATAEMVTRRPIKEALARAEMAAVREVLPQGVPEPEERWVIMADGTSNKVYIAGRAIALEASSTKGYGGTIRVMFGFDEGGRLYNYTVLDHRETPGLGDKIKDVFKTSVTNRPATTVWRVKKDGGKIDAITAATVSSRAMLDAIERAYQIRERALKMKNEK